MSNIYLATIKALIHRFPAVVPHLKGKARWIAFAFIDNFPIGNTVYTETNPLGFTIRDTSYKTVEYFESELTRMVTNVYEGNLGGEFIDILANLISGQLTQAYEQAWADNNGEGDLPDYLTESVESMILNQYDFVDQFYRDIVDARVDEEPIEPLLARVPLWANRWEEAYNTAILLITSNEGGNLEWQLGETEEHCETCSALNGIVARASEWEQLGVYPQSAPNEKLECGGWKCDCSLTPTDKRRSPKAFDSIMNAVSK